MATMLVEPGQERGGEIVWRDVRQKKRLNPSG
jgi:hypothetical protein